MSSIAVQMAGDGEPFRQGFGGVFDRIIRVIYE
jgi:hypothetical protein